MPLVTVTLWEEQLNPETESRVIRGMTDAVVDVLGEQVRSFVTVLVTGIPQRRWGTGGVPASAPVPAGGPETHPRST